MPGEFKPGDRVVSRFRLHTIGTIRCYSVSAELIHVHWDGDAVSGVIRREYLRRVSLLEEIALVADGA